MPTIKGGIKLVPGKVIELPREIAEVIKPSFIVSNGQSKNNQDIFTRGGTVGISSPKEVKIESRPVEKKTLKKK